MALKKLLRLKQNIHALNDQNKCATNCHIYVSLSVVKTDFIHKLKTVFATMTF